MGPKLLKFTYLPRLACSSAGPGKIAPDAAAQELRLAGYSGAGIDEIAKRAGLTSGAFYRHFSSKKIFAIVITEGLNEILEGAFQDGLNAIIRELSDDSDKSAAILHTNWILAALALMAGGLMLARASKSKRLADEIAVASSQKVLELLLPKIRNTFVRGLERQPTSSSPPSHSMTRPI
jgi:AcrR family transcriptional regulator